MSSKTPKLTKNSRAVKALEKLFKTGQINGTEKPAEVYAMHESFKAHIYRNFADKYRKMREELADPDEKVEEDLDLRCTNSKSESTGKRRRSEVSDTEGEDNEDYQQGVELILDSKSFKPLSYLAEWVEPMTMIRRVTVSIILPAGVHANQYTVRVVDAGSVLELTVQWPNALSDVERMHRKWLTSDNTDKMQPYHPEILGFQKALKSYRQRVGEEVKSTARIALPFAVETHIVEKHNLAWRDGQERMVYIRLRAAVDDYALQSDKQDFEIV